MDEETGSGKLGGLPRVPYHVSDKLGLQPTCLHVLSGRTGIYRTLIWPTGHLCVLPRFLQGLQQGLSMLRQELPTESDLAYADFLSLDISMLRLFESFLEATPQLTLVLAIILQSGNSEYYQCECWASDYPLGSLPVSAVFSILGGQKENR